MTASLGTDRRARYGNLTVLPDTSQLRALHTVIRDRDAPPAEFTRYSRRVIRLVLETAIGQLPFDRHEVTTPVGHSYDGLRLASGLCGVALVRAGESMEAELRDLEPGVRYFGTDQRPGR